MDKVKKAEWMYIDKWAKKYKAVNQLGSKCIQCGNDDFRILQFHHTNENEKECGVREIRQRSFDIIEKEIKKCVLLCPNCHAEHHYQECGENRNRDTKIELLKIKNLTACEECGYDKFIGALDFHHRDEKQKSFMLSDITKETKIIQLGVILIDEIEKCDLLCRNCHSLKHIDTQKIEKYMQKITNKKWRVNNKAPKDKIIELHNQGNSYDKIVNILNVPKSTVGTILRKYKKMGD